MISPPIIIIPDTTPLIHLAAGELLDVLPTLGHVVVSDVVALEATRLPDKPWAAEIAAWFKAAAVEVVDTELGKAYRLAIAAGRRPPRNIGEDSIIEWLRANLAASGQGTFLVLEDTRFERRITRERLGTAIVALTTRDLVEIAERRGIISSAEDAFGLIQARVPTVSPASSISFRKPAP